MAEEKKNEDIRPGIAKEQKIGLFLLLIFTVLAVGLGALQMRNTLYGPFALQNTAPDISVDDVNTVEAQQLRDTDRDGLNDFDELYVYTTSIYLADTDSDGLTDKEEVDNGKNPLCAEGEECGGITDGDSAVVSNISSTLKIMGVSSDLGEAPADINAILQDPAQIKKLLSEAGVEAEVLNSVSDDDLMIMVNQIMSASSTTNIETLNTLSAYSSSTKPTTTKK